MVTWTSHSCLKSSYKGERPKLFSAVTENEAATNCILEGFMWWKREIFFHWKDEEMLEKAVQGAVESPSKDILMI